MRRRTKRWMSSDVEEPRAKRGRVDESLESTDADADADNESYCESQDEDTDGESESETSEEAESPVQNGGEVESQDPPEEPESPVQNGGAGPVTRRRAALRQSNGHGEPDRWHGPIKAEKEARARMRDFAVMDGLERKSEGRMAVLRAKAEDAAKFEHYDPSWLKYRDSYAQHLVEEMAGFLRRNTTREMNEELRIPAVEIKAVPSTQPSALKYRPDVEDYPLLLMINASLTGSHDELTVVVAHGMAHWYALACGSVDVRTPRGRSDAAQVDAENDASAHSNEDYIWACELLASEYGTHPTGDYSGVLPLLCKAVFACECGAYFCSMRDRQDASGKGLEHARCPFNGRRVPLDRRRRFQRVAVFDADDPPDGHPLHALGFLGPEVAQIMIDEHEDATRVRHAPYQVPEPCAMSERERYHENHKSNVLRCFLKSFPPSACPAPSSSDSESESGGSDQSDSSSEPSE